MKSETLKQKLKGEPLKTYKLIGKNGKENITLTIADLIPIDQKDTYDFNELVNLISYRDYEPEWTQGMDEEYDLLYRNIENKGCDFFKVAGEALIIMPGRHIYPTILTEQQIINGF